MRRTMDDLLDTRQLAARLDLQPATLEQWRWSSKGPAYVKLGGRVRYRVQDLESWIESRERRSTSDTGDEDGLPAR